MSDPIVLVSVARTPMGSMMGNLSGLAAHELGAVAIRAAVERAGIAGEAINEVIMGNVLQAGQGQAPARQAALGAGLPLGVACSTLHKVCGSGLKAVMLAHDIIKAESADVVVAGGQESMSNAPYLLLRGRQGYRYGHSTVYDHMALDGLEDAYKRGTAMGVFAEDCASKYSFTREQQDAFSLESLRRARGASEDGSFKWEIAPVTIQGRKGDTVIDTDEAPFKAMPEKIPTLKPAFKKDG
ncbi:MAG TPA: acetyl-CoA C-acetyltransferase, partial [Castellaniella sp.]|nr:acetyl-CoA C-acetyltransferase [Castellaniella sp.]